MKKKPGEAPLLAPGGCATFRLALPGLLMAAGAMALPADAQQESAEVKLEKVEVTGTNIRRIEGESGLPVQVITRAEIERGGVVTAKDLLDRISANQSYGGWTDDKGVGNTLAGYTGASLRGLGAERTLVLLNGRRLAPYALSGGQSVDLSGIPASAIERVEVLKDGASAVYGTDAIGGVINFVLRKDFRGVEASATYMGVQHGGGENARASLTAGWGDLAKDRFNAFVNIDHIRQEALRSIDREYSKTSYFPDFGADRTSTNSVPANITQPGGFRGTFNPTIPLTGATPSSCDPPFSFPTVGFPTRCRFDYAAVIDSIAESRKTNLIGRVSWQVAPDHLAFAEGSWYRGEFVYKVSPTPVNSQFTFTPMTLPPGSPYYPAAFVASLPRGNTNLPLGLSYRLLELGPRVNTPDVEQWRAIAGLQGVLGGWDYQFAAGHTANKQVDNYSSGYVSETLFGPLLRSGVVNPFGPNSPEILERLRATQIIEPASRNRASHTAAELKVSGTPWELAAGPVAVALGVDARREQLELVSSEFLYTGDVVGGAGVVPSLESRTRPVWSLFGEANVPILKSLEANVAVRYDHYGDFGGTTNPKFTLRWQPTRDVVLRGSVGTGFRAPTIYDLFQPNFEGFINGYEDPLRCPVTGADEDCADSFYTTKLGGNPGLQPETSRQMNVGVIFEPSAGFSVALDYYQVRINDLIVAVPYDAIFQDYQRWAPTHVFRKPPDAQNPNLPGPIDYVLGTFVNAGRRDTSGIDLDVRYRIPWDKYGRITVALSGTYILTYEASEFESVAPGTSDFVDGNGALARWRHYASIDWERGPWGATLAQNFQNGYSEPDLRTADPATGVPTGTRRVGTASVLDLQVRYTGIKGLTASLGIRNLFDRAPPFALYTNSFQVGYEPAYADPRGRMYYASFRYAFR